MFTLKPFSLTKSNGVNIVTTKEHLQIIPNYDGNTKNHMYFWVFGKTHAIWSFNMSSKQWTKLIENFKPVSDEDKSVPNHTFEKIIGSIKEGNLIKIFSFDLVNQRALSIMRTFNLTTKEVDKCEIEGDIKFYIDYRDLIRYGKYYYTIISDDEPKVYRFNTETTLWEEVDTSFDETNLQEIVAGGPHPSFCPDKIIYYFNPFVRRRLLEEPLTNVSVFKLENHSWYILRTIGDSEYFDKFPVHKMGYNTALYKDPKTNELNILFSGAYYSTGDSNDFWSLNMESLKWSILRKFGLAKPSSIHEHVSFITQAGKLFIFGKDEPGDCSVDVLGDLPNSVHSAWLTIPELTDISWEAVCFYYPEMFSMTEDEIVQKYGIPLPVLKSRLD